MIKQKPLIKILKEKVRDLNNRVKYLIKDVQRLEVSLKSNMDAVKYFQNKSESLLAEKYKKRMDFINIMDNKIKPCERTTAYLTISVEDYKLLRDGKGIVAYKEFKEKITQQDIGNSIRFSYIDYAFNGEKSEQFIACIEEEKIYIKIVKDHGEDNYKEWVEKYVNKKLYEFYLEKMAWEQ